jgi:hypothetical protein
MTKQKQREKLYDLIFVTKTKASDLLKMRDK